VKADDFWVKIDRRLIKAASEVGDSAFRLFLYLKTFEGASEGIRPSLQRISDDLGSSKSAVCNLKKKLRAAHWIEEQKGVITITKSFILNEQRSLKMNGNSPDHSRKMNDHSRKMNESFSLNERPIKEENDQLERTESKSSRTPKSCYLPDGFAPSSEMLEWARVKCPKVFGALRVDSETEKFIDHFRSSDKKYRDWQATWRNWMRRAEEGRFEPPGRLAPNHSESFLGDRLGMAA
jgi:hypothetical protein